MSDNKNEQTVTAPISKKTVTVAKYGKQTFVESPPINPLAINIETLEVKDKSYAGYFKQIKQNMMIAGKAVFIVCRDLYDAKVNLIKVEKVLNQKGEEEEVHITEEYDQLTRHLGISPSTERKYLSIGRYLPLRELFKEGRLPTSWTTVYFLTTLTKDQLETIWNKISVDTTRADITKTLQIKSDKKEVVDADYTFATIKVAKTCFVTLDMYESFKDELLKNIEAMPPLKKGSFKIELNKSVHDKLEREELSARKKNAKSLTPSSIAKANEKHQTERNHMNANGNVGPLDAFVTA